MICVCIYCGENKAMALEECASCLRSPGSQNDVIHSIILCFSETEPYLNFIGLDEIEAVREKILAGSALDISREVFKSAEEAYSAVESSKGPKGIQFFSNMSVPVITLVVLSMLAAALFI